MATFTREYERITCPGCNRTISAYVPHFGDGSGLRVVPHNVIAPGQLARRRHATRPCVVSDRIIVRERGRWRIDP